MTHGATAPGANRRGHWRRTGLAALLVAPALGACAAGAIRGPPLPPAPLPTYELGDTFVFDNGSVATVSVVWPDNDDRVTWRTAAGRTSVAVRNFAVPDLQWTTRTRNGRFETAADLATLWPLIDGNRAVFEGRATLENERADTVTVSARRYVCAVDGTWTVTVAAGTFETFQIRCLRLSTPEARRTSVRTLRWYYAPALGHYVLRTIENQRGRVLRRVELAAVRRSHDSLAAAQRAAIADLRTTALTTLRSGETGDWADPAGAASARVAMQSTFQTDTGTVCRRYVETVRTAAGQTTAPGIACREADGTWRRL